MIRVLLVDDDEELCALQHDYLIDILPHLRASRLRRWIPITG